MDIVGVFDSGIWSSRDGKSLIGVDSKKKKWKETETANVANILKPSGIKESRKNMEIVCILKSFLFNGENYSMVYAD